MDTEISKLTINEVVTYKLLTQRRSVYRQVISSHYEDGKRISYFLGALGTNNFKIGTVKNAHGIIPRMRCLQAGNPNTLFLISFVDMPEKTLHEKFSHLRTNGEWFTFTSEIDDFLKSLYDTDEW